MISTVCIMLASFASPAILNEEAKLANWGHQVVVHPAGDRDWDGLPDEWETRGHGPINPSVHGCRPDRADMFLIVCIRPGMTRAQVQPTLDKVKEFFARIPGTNPDGSTGINVIIVWGNTIPEANRTTDYRAVYEIGMPREWRGIGHGILLEPGTGGGGQSNRSDWAGVSNNWHTVVHELGHQLGLEHHPRGNPDPSPIYASIMNYDYNYQFNGDANAVQFSTGKFASLRLNEARLSENIPFPSTDLEFLTKAPYFFQVRRVGANASQVDWNRNGVFGENNIRADINDGYSVHLVDVVNVGKAAGAPTMATLGSSLAVIYPDLPTGGNYATWQEAGLTAARPGRLSYRIHAQGRLGEPGVLVPSGAGGDPHAIEAFGKIFVTYPVSTSFMIQAFDHPTEGGRPQVHRLRRLGLQTDLRVTTGVQPILVKTLAPETLWLFMRDESDGTIKYRKVNVTDADGRFRMDLGPMASLNAGVGSAATPVRSNGAIMAVWNSKIERIALVTLELDGTTEGRMRIHQLGRVGADGWYSQNTRWTTGAGGFTRTRARPTVVYDGSASRGPYGHLLIYHKGDNANANIPEINYVCAQIEDRSQADGWRVRMMGNEWCKSRSSPAAALYGGDIAYAFRWFGGDNDNDLYLHLKGSGISTGVLTDFDDVTYIMRTGLRNSIMSVGGRR